MKRQRTSLYIGTILIVAFMSMGMGCPKGTQNLATASRAISHSLANAQAASKQALAANVISQQDEDQFETYLSQVAQAGQVLDKGIRNNESAATLSGKVNSFLDAFNQLNTIGLIGIKNQNLKLTLSTIITTAESSVAIIAATVGK